MQRVSRVLRSGAPPLAGLRVLELASVLAGPSVGQFLAELGADVVKVENKRTKGDVTRGWRLPGEGQSRVTAYFSGCNLGKRSVALDAALPQGRQLCRRLAAVSDVVLASYKPGDAEKLGLDAAVLRAEHPRLVYAQITGYGLDDARVGYDAIIQAEAGFTFINGQPGAEGRPTKMPVALVDLLAAHQLKEAVLLALLRRERTGEGSHMHVSLMSAAVASLANQASGWLRAGVVPQRMGSEHPSICPYGLPFDDREGKQLILGVGADSQFRSLCAALGCPELGVDPRYATNAARVDRRAELNALLAEKIRLCSREELLADLYERKVPAGLVADMPAVFATPQAEALVVREATREATSGSEQGRGEALGLRQVAWLGDQATAQAPRRPPEYGEHTVEVLQELLGMPASEVSQLVAEGVIEAPGWEASASE